MERQENNQNTNEEQNTIRDCCDFSSEEASRMFKMMKDFCRDPEKGSSDCCSMMKDMSSQSNSCC